MIKDLEMRKLSWIIWVSLNAMTSVLIREEERFDTKESNVTKRQRWEGMRLQAKE